METGSSSLRFDLLLASVRGVREWRALALLLFGGIVWAVLVAGLTALIGPAVGLILGVIIGALCWFVTYLGAGRIFMSRARGEEGPAGFVAALQDGIALLPRGIALLILLALAGIAIGVAEVIVFLLCKIPHLGPVLYFFLQPAGMLVAAVAGFALWVVSLLAMPALWDGRGVVESIRSAWASLRSNPGEVGFLLLALMVLVWMVSAVIATILFAGAAFSMGLGVAVTAGGGYGASALGGGTPLLGIFGGNPAYQPGIIFGWIAVWILILLLPAGMLLQGQALVYSAVTGDKAVASRDVTPAGDAVS